ncbi:Substrate-specific component BioY of biotin ECF transporter [Olavius sp. associated proteobacterium Delta 1]|nr:Substrate-specific component BioY of biotin ECF transporter [Olavius sp. associated proteobacterium Delta 1]
MKDINQLRMLVFASLLAALMAAGAFLAIPIGPVPIVLQNMFVFLAGLLLGSRWALASVAVYLLAGACGLPVFAGGMGGIGRIVGPTGGYLIGYLPAVFIVGYISEKAAARIGYDVLAMICGTIVLYACGVAWLKILTGMTWSKTLTVGMYPFLIGDGIKIVAAAWIAKALRPIIRVPVIDKF